ncbi:MAG: large-conductance mechanosensitive channel protein MscL [Myxococcales bacterium]|nr:large-conductance mechanosensitive channel protein MscL [Myxococcales bacterium]MCB9630339.1 large-conductance mechanosensitive channel protein MscL [Sandaracinaceae bacterium]
MSIVSEFKEFAVKGNVVDMAVGIIIGGAFGTIVKSLVEDVIMPPIGLAMGGVDFSALQVVLKDASTNDAGEAVAAVAIKYGVFLNNVLSFLIVAFAVFMLVKSINKLKKKEVAAPPADPTTKECSACFSTIHIKATRCPNCTTELKAA